MSGLGTGFDHPATEAVAAIDAALDALQESNLWSLPTAELGRLLVGLETTTRRVDAVRVELTAQAERAGVAQREGATTLAAFLRARADVAPRLTRDRLRLHAALASRDITREAFAAGAISQRGAEAVCEALDTLPADVPASMITPVEQLLVDTAADEGTPAVARRAMEVVHRFAPDALARREAAATEHDRFHLALRPDGGIRFAGSYGIEAAARVLPVLNAFAAPKPAVDGVPDLRDADRRYADAFIDICTLAGADPAAPSHRGEPPHINVTISYEALRKELGQAPGRLDHGAPLSAEAARMLACDAKIIPIVLGSQSEPLDIGRASRIWPPSIARAITARDGGCVMPGCDRPPSWARIHHLRFWAEGGETKVGNGALVCEPHHSRVHKDGWIIQIRDGLPWVIPPAWIDATRTPRLHSRFKNRKLEEP
jgi:hypothetical protein